MATLTKDPLVTHHENSDRGTINLNTALHRIQAIHGAPEKGVMAGDLKDCCEACPDQTDPVVVRILAACAGKSNAQDVVVDTADVTHITDLLAVRRVKVKAVVEQSQAETSDPKPEPKPAPDNFQKARAGNK